MSDQPASPSSTHDGRHGLRTREIVDQDVRLDVAEAADPQIETFARSDWHAPARRPASDDDAPAAQQPRSRAEAAIASGRRSQRGFTQAGEDEAEAQTPASDERPVYRIRDFRPESRRSAFSSTSELSPSDWGRPGAAGEPGNLDYHTQQRLGAPAASDAEADVTSGSASEVTESGADETVDRAKVEQARAEEGRATAVSDPTEPAASNIAEFAPAVQETERPHEARMLTRRELRAMRESSAPAAEPHALQEPQAEQAPQFPPPLQAPEPEPQSARQLSNALAEFDALMGSDTSDDPAPLTAAAPTAVPVQQAAEQPAPAVTAEAPGVSAVDARESTPELSAPWSIPPAASEPTAAQPAPEPEADGPVSAASGTGSHATGLETPITELSVEPTPAASPDASGSADASRPFTVPTGHWSTQAAADDDTDGVAVTRNIGVPSGSATPNHLVISSVPNAKDLLLPFSPTGEIMVTGTIDLPRSLGTTGAHPARYDHSDVDALLEAGDREDSDVDSAPVRAIRAVSTHTSSRGLIGTGKPPRSSRLPMVLAVSTAALATVVVVLFVAGFVLHLF